MQYIPSPRDFRRSVAYAIVAALAAFFLIPLTFPGFAEEVAVLLIVLGLFAYFFLKFRELRKYGFDEKGVYQSGRLLFPWSRVGKMGLKFGKGGGSVTLVTPPTLGALLSGGVVQRETLVTYSVSLVFNLEDGSTVTIPSNLDRLTSRGLIEKVDEVARAANPRIEFV